MEGKHPWILYQSWNQQETDSTFRWDFQRDHFWGVGRVQMATGMLRPLWPSRGESQPHPSLKGRWLETVLLDLVLLDWRWKGHLIIVTEKDSQRQPTAKHAGGINTLTSLSFSSLVSCLCLLLGRKPETRVPGWCHQTAGRRQCSSPQSRVGRVTGNLERQMENSMNEVQTTQTLNELSK